MSRETREGVRVLSQALMELEVAQRLGAKRYERTGDRTGQRNGHREQAWDMRVGTIDLSAGSGQSPCYAARAFVYVG